MLSKFIHNKPSGFNDTSESNQQDKYSLDTNNLASVFIQNPITQVCPIGQCIQASQIIGRRRVPSRITWHVHGTVYERARHSVRTPTTARTNDTRSSVYTTGRGRNAATLTVPTSSSQLQLAFRRTFPLSTGLYGLRPALRCSPGRGATGYPCSRHRSIMTGIPHYRPAAPNFS